MVSLELQMFLLIFCVPDKKSLKKGRFCHETFIKLATYWGSFAARPKKVEGKVILLHKRLSVVKCELRNTVLLRSNSLECVPFRMHHIQCGGQYV